MPTALVTGASSGIGLELTGLLARDRHDLVLVARGRERLETVARGLAEEFGIRAVVVAADLSLPEAPAAIAQELRTRAIGVDVLVNDAGFGAHGFFAKIPLEEQLAMIRVNVGALTNLTGLFLPAMLERRSGRILNVASTAAFQPGPLMAVYYATKAYVLSFSEALASETSGTGVTVTALCPGPVPTEFQRRAGTEKTTLVSGPLSVPASAVAEAGYRGMLRGRPLVVPGVGNRVLMQALRVSPRRLVTAVSKRLQEKRGD
jgi:short-subunit dehydrogenase